MKTYWPTAKYRAKDGTINDLFTYDGFESIENAQDQIRLWADGYDLHLISAEIKVIWNNGRFTDDILRVF